MNAERLQTVLDSVRSDFARDDLAALVSAVATAYSQSLSSPSETAIRNVDDQLASLVDVTATSATAVLSPSMKRILDHIGGSQLVGDGLASRVSQLVSEHSGTPARTVVELQQLATKVTEFRQAVSQAFSSLTDLSIKPEKLPLDSCEVGVAIPEEFVGSSLGGFQRKLGEFDRTIRTFAEVSGEEVVSPPLKDLSRGSYEFFVQVGPLTGAAIVTAIERSVALYRQVLEIRKLRAELERKEVPAPALEGVKSHESTMINAEVARSCEEIISLYEGDKARRNELATALAAAVKFLAGQIDKGVDVEVSCHAPPATGSTDEDSTVRPKSLLDAYERVRVGGSAVRDLPKDRSPVLFLPPSTSEPPAPEEPSHPPKTKQSKQKSGGV